MAIQKNVFNLNRIVEFFKIFPYFLFFPFAFFVPRFIPGLLIYVALFAVFGNGNRLLNLLRSNVLFVLMFLFLAYGALSALWSESASFTLKEALKISFYAIAGFLSMAHIGFLSISEKKRILSVVLMGAVVSFIIWMLLYITHFEAISYVFKDMLQYDLGTFRRGAHLCAILFMPLSMFLWFEKKRILSALCVALFFTVIYISTKQTAFYVIFLTIPVIVMTYFFKASFIRFLQIFTIVFLLFAPIVVKPFIEPAISYANTAGEKDIRIPTSLLHRLKIWEFTSEKIKEKPIQGYGFASSRFVAKGAKTSLIISIKPYVKNWTEEDKQHIKSSLWHLEGLPLLPLHPHNAFLQIWLEMGIVGVLIAAAFLYFLFEKGIELRHNRQQLLFMATIFPVIIVENMSYGIWQSWWISSLFMIVFILQAMISQLQKD